MLWECLSPRILNHPKPEGLEAVTDIRKTETCHRDGLALIAGHIYSQEDEKIFADIMYA